MIHTFACSLQKRFFFPGVEEIFPNASHVQRIPSALGAFSLCHPESLCLGGTEPPGCSYQRELVVCPGRVLGTEPWSSASCYTSTASQQALLGSTGKEAATAALMRAEKKNPSELKAGIDLLGYQV